MLRTVHKSELFADQMAFFTFKNCGSTTSLNFRPQISSALPALDTDEIITIEDELEDEVLLEPKKKSKFLQRVWSWLQSKYKVKCKDEMSKSAPNSASPRRKTMELHARKIFNARVVNDNAKKQEKVIFPKVTVSG